MKTRFFDPSKPRLFSHRGSNRYPENTLPAFLDALGTGLIYIELDVWCSRDGVPVVHHDGNFLRTCGVDREVNDLDASEIRKLDAGFHYSPDQGRTFPYRGGNISIPTLEEVLANCREALFNIEIKQSEPAIEQQVIATVEQAGMLDQVLLASEKESVTARVRQLHPDIPTNLCFGEVVAFFSWMKSGRRDEYRPLGNALQIPMFFRGIELVTPDSVQTAHDLGLEVHVWTVNNFAVMKRLLRLGVDGIMSDRPGLLGKLAHPRHQ